MSDGTRSPFWIDKAYECDVGRSREEEASSWRVLKVLGNLKGWLEMCGGKLWHKMVKLTNRVTNIRPRMCKIN